MNRARSKRLVLASSCVALVASGLAAANEQLVTLDTRSGVQQKFLLLKPDKPVAAVVLFPGGNGVAELGGSTSSPSVGRALKNNFLVRTRESFVAGGLVTAVMDAPSDHQGNRGMLGGFRAGAEHCQDVDAVIRHVKAIADVPVWLVGTSRGTESAANCAIRLNGVVSGLVLTSTMTRANSNGKHVSAMKIEEVRVPVQVVAHQDDGCEHTPARDAPELVEKFVNAPRKEVKVLAGGDKAKAKPCQAMTPHGFLGIEDQAVGEIVRFIKSGA